MDEKTALRVLRENYGVQADEAVRRAVGELAMVQACDEILAELMLFAPSRETARERFLELATRLCNEMMEGEWEPSQRIPKATQGHKLKRQLPTPESSQERIQPITPPAKRQQLDTAVLPIEPPSPSKSIDSPTAQRHRPLPRPSTSEPYVVCPAGASQGSFNAKLERMPWLCTVFLLHFLSSSSKWSWSQINLTRLRDLQKSNKPVEEGIELIKAIAREVDEMESIALADELGLRLLVKEAEQELASFTDIVAVGKGKGKALGSFDDKADGFVGGKIKYEGKISVNTTRMPNQAAEPLTIKLSAPVLGPSCHFTRRFGSDCVLRLRFMPAKGGKYLNDSETEELHHLCQRPIVVAGRIFRLIYNNDGVLYFAAINPIVKRPAQSIFASRFSHPELASLQDLCQWWGEPSLNGHQKLAKWSARLHLLFSPTEPVARLEHIEPVDDIISPAHSSPDLPAHMIMTDGVCWLSSSVMKQAQLRLGLEYLPAALQARINGSKGVWILDPQLDAKEGSRIGIRPSQRKIQLSPTADDSWTILNVVRPSKMSSPASLSYQLLPLLTHAGVPVKTLTRLQSETLADCGQAVMEWAARDDETRDAHRLRMTKAVFETGIVGGRLRRKEGSAGRAKGIGNMEAEEEEEEDDVDERRYDGYGSEMSLPSAPSTAIARDPHSGQPNSLAETALELLAAGFLPEDNFYLAAKLFNLASSALDNCIRGSKRFNLPIASSASAMCIVDELGVLEEDEISFCFSQPLMDDDGLPITELVGDVLVIRSPAYLPSDIIRMKAVFRLGLRTYKDVVVFSAKGSRSTASRLSGGDYDGDRVTVVWHQPLVQPFRNAPISLCDPPFALDKMFDQDKSTVRSLYADMASLEPSGREAKLQQVLSASVRAQSLTGDYSKMHFARAWKFGMADPIAIELAHKAALCLDAGKSGMQIKPSVLSADRREADKLGDPKVWNVIKDRFAHTTNAGRTATRSLREEHVLDVIDKYADRIKEQKKSAYAAQRLVVKDACQRREDTDVSARWRAREADGEAGDDEKADLELIREDLGKFLKVHVYSSEMIAAKKERARNQTLGSPTKTPKKTSADGTPVEEYVS